MRAGTENVAGIVGFARAAELAAQEQEAEERRVRELRDDPSLRGLEALTEELAAGVRR